jgi:hypothetical protein
MAAKEEAKRKGKTGRSKPEADPTGEFYLRVRLPPPPCATV